MVVITTTYIHVRHATLDFVLEISSNIEAVSGTERELYHTARCP